MRPGPSGAEACGRPQTTGGHTEVVAVGFPGPPNPSGSPEIHQEVLRRVFCAVISMIVMSSMTPHSKQCGELLEAKSS